MMAQWEEGQDLKVSAESHFKLETIYKALRKEVRPESEMFRMRMSSK